MIHFKNLELYYLAYYKSFTKSSDLISLFYHWYMIQNDFECMANRENTSEVLPLDWNESPNTVRYYIKNDKIYYFELDSNDTNLCLVKIRKINTSFCLFQKIKLNDFVSNFKQDKFRLAFQNIEKLYLKIERFFQHFEQSDSISIKEEIKQEFEADIKPIQLNQLEIKKEEENKSILNDFKLETKENIMQSLCAKNFSIFEKDLFQKEPFKGVRHLTSFKLTPQMKKSLNLTQNKQGVNTRSKKRK